MLRGCLTKITITSLIYGPGNRLWVGKGMADRVIRVQGQNVHSISSLLLFARRKERKSGRTWQIADPFQSDQGAEHVSGAELTIRYPAFHIITKSRDFWKKHEVWNLCTSAMYVNVTVKKSTIYTFHLYNTWWTFMDGLAIKKQALRRWLWKVNLIVQ